MEIEDGKLYILTSGTRDIVTPTKEEAIEELQDIVQGEPSMDEIEFHELDLSGEEWEIRPVQWRDVAAQIIEA